MADPSQLPPGVDPSDWFAAQRQQQLSDILTQSAFADPTPHQPAGGGKYYQAARTGPISALSKLAEAMMAKKAFSKSAQMNAANYANALQAFTPEGGQTPGASLQAAPPAADPTQQSVQPALQRAPGQSFDQTVQGSQPQQRPTNPYNPQGLPPSVMMRLYQSDPGKYASLVAGPESVQLGKMAGMQGQQAAQAAFAKGNSLDARPGGDILIPDGKGGYTHIRNPSLATGEVPTFDQLGNITGTQMLPGHIANQAALQGAETGAREQNTPRMIPQGGGVEKLGYPPTPPSLQQPGAPQGRYFGKPPTPPMPAAPGPGGAPPAPTSAPPGEPWLSGVPKLAVPNTPGETTDTFHQTLLKDAATRHSALTEKFGNEADLADQKMQYNNQAMKYLGSAETGPSSNWLTEHRANLLEWGVPKGLIPNSGTVTPTMELNKNLKQSALQGARSIFGSRMTQMEVKLQHDELSPSTSMTKDAIASLIQQDNIKAGYAKQRANDYGKYVQSGGDPMQFERYYATKRPLSRFAAQYTTPPAAIDRVTKNPALLDDFKTKFGWDPTQ